jgi:phenol/toluene 2-monooxygenase (NADH) P3/A3
VQGWMPPQQIFQGNCGGEGLENVLKWYNLNLGADNMDFTGSPEDVRWKQWKGLEPEAESETLDEAANA